MTKLNEKLQAVLDLVGNTPIAEPEIAEILEAKVVKKTKVVKLAFSKLDGDLNIKDFPAVEIAEFFSKLTSKIMNKKNEDGVFKSTPNTENLNLPDFEEVEDIFEIIVQLNTNSQQQDEIQKNLKNGIDVEQEIIDKSIKELTSILKKLDKIVWKVSGLNKKDLTEWEQSLVSEQILASVTEVEKTSVGKQ